jgi:hypothetical protein
MPQPTSRSGPTPEQSGGWTPVEDAKKGVHLFVLVASVLARPVEVILRRRFGSRYFGVPSLLALFAVPGWMAFWPGESPMAIWWFEGLFVLAQLGARVEQLRMVATNDVVHTRYNGWPRLAAIFRKADEATLKGAIEPVLVILTGLFLMPVSEPLGSYLMTSGLCLAFIESVIRSVDRARALEINDTLIEQQNAMDRFRALSRDRSRH